MKRRQLLGAPLAVAGAWWGGFSWAAEPLVAWVGGILNLGEGTRITDGTLLTRGDRIEAVGAGGPVPALATVRELKGQIVTPGLVGVQTALGLVEVSAESGSRDERPRSEEVGGEDPVRAAFAAHDGLNPLSTLLAVARRGGVTSAIATPRGGLVAGSGAWLDLEEPHGPSSVVKSPVAIHGSFAGYSRPGAWRLLRDALLDARLYARSPAAYDRGATRALRLRPVDAQALAPVLGGKLPLVLELSRAADIRRALALAEQFELRLVVSGGEEAWLVGELLARAGVPVVVRPSANLPGTFSALHAHAKNAARLARAGVELNFSTFDEHSLHNLRLEAGLAMAAGLDSQVALSAVTHHPARWAGLEASHGTLRPGRYASFCVWTGEPLEPSNWPTRVVIRGRQSPLDSRGQRLLERYRSLDSIPRGRADSASR